MFAEKRIIHVVIFLLRFAKTEETNKCSNDAEEGSSDTNLSEHGVELFPRAVVTSLRQKLLDLLPDLIFIQMPAVIIINAGACSWVRGT